MEIDLSLLALCILALDDYIMKTEALLESGDDEDPAETQDLIFSYEKAALRLRAAYLWEWKPSCNLPDYEQLMEGRKKRWVD